MTSLRIVLRSADAAGLAQFYALLVRLSGGDPILVQEGSCWHLTDRHSPTAFRFLTALVGTDRGAPIQFEFMVDDLRAAEERLSAECSVPIAIASHSGRDVSYFDPAGNVFTLVQRGP